jgi:hypothetical protein
VTAGIHRDVRSDRGQQAANQHILALDERRCRGSWERERVGTKLCFWWRRESSRRQRCFHDVKKGRFALAGFGSWRTISCARDQIHVCMAIAIRFVACKVGFTRVEVVDWMHFAEFGCSCLGSVVFVLVVWLSLFDFACLALIQMQSRLALRLRVWFHLCAWRRVMKFRLDKKLCASSYLCNMQCYSLSESGPMARVVQLHVQQSGVSGRALSVDSVCELAGNILKSNWGTSSVRKRDGFALSSTPGFRRATPCGNNSCLRSRWHNRH